MLMHIYCSKKTGDMPVMGYVLVTTRLAVPYRIYWPRPEGAFVRSNLKQHENAGE